MRKKSISLEAQKVLDIMKIKNEHDLRVHGMSVLREACRRRVNHETIYELIDIVSAANY